MSENGLICSGAGGGTRTPGPRITKTQAAPKGRENTSDLDALSNGGQPKTAPIGPEPVQKRAHDLIPLADAAATLGIEPKRLLGFMARNSIGDPIGGSTPDGIMVYAWSLEPLRMRLRAADDSTAGGPGAADEAGAVKLTTDREAPVI